MYFNITGGEKDGLIQDVLNLVHTTTASYAKEDITRNLNQSYHDVTRLIWESSGAWQFDDSNKSDFPIATTNLVDTKQDYELPSLARRIERIEVKNSSGDYKKLNQIDQHDVPSALSEFKETDGMPYYYDLLGSSVFLYPAPSSSDVTTSNGLKILFQRDVDEFTTSDTTAVPGFPTQFHRILSYSAALDYEEDSGNRERLMIERERLINGLIGFYSNRNVERRAKIRPERGWERYV